MNCELVNNYIDALTSANMSADIKIDIKDHLQTCANCTQALQQQKTYLIKVSGIQTPELSEHTAAIMLSKVTHQTASNDSSFLKGFIAASVLAVSIFGAWNLYNTSPELMPIEVVSNEEADYFITEVVLVINAQEDMYDADLNIVLPQQIALEGYSNLQELSWAVDLKAGVNTLSLPIRVNKHRANEQPLSIMAKLYHYAEEREFEIKVDVEKIQFQQKNSVYLTPKNNTSRV